LSATCDSAALLLLLQWQALAAMVVVVLCRPQLLLRLQALPYQWSSPALLKM
jgi:hypothetical protein